MLQGIARLLRSQCVNPACIASDHTFSSAVSFFLRRNMLTPTTSRNTQMHALNDFTHGDQLRSASLTLPPSCRHARPPHLSALPGCGVGDAKCTFDGFFPFTPIKPKTQLEAPIVRKTLVHTTMCAGQSDPDDSFLEQGRRGRTPTQDRNAQPAHFSHTQQKPVKNGTESLRGG